MPSRKRDARVSMHLGEVLCIEAGCRAFMTTRRVQSGLLQGAARNASKSWHQFLRSKTSCRCRADRRCQITDYDHVFDGATGLER